MPSFIGDLLRLVGFIMMTRFEPPKTKPQISCAVTDQRLCAVNAQLISAFAFAARIVQSFFLNPKFQASMAVQAGLCQTCSKPKLLVFLCTGSFWICMFSRQIIIVVFRKYLVWFIRLVVAPHYQMPTCPCNIGQYTRPIYRELFQL